MSFFIFGLGTAVPRELITQDDAARLAVELAGESCSHGPAMQMLYRKTGVHKRHSTLITTSTNGQPATQSFFPVATAATDRGPTTHTRMRQYEAAALELATQAALAAMRGSSGTTSDEIAHLVTVSCTGFHAPGVDIGLIDHLALKQEVSRTHIGYMGCHGALNGLRIASALSRAHPGEKVLLCCVELCSLHHQYAADPQQMVANALFSDGAAAVVGSFSNREAPWRVVDQFSCVLPATTDLMSWRIGDHGFVMRLSPHVPYIIEQTLRPWLAEHLSRHSLAVDDVRSWAIHPGGPRILTACADSLGIDHAFLEPSRRVLADFGNMSSPTVLFILEQLRGRNDNLPCVALAFGPGLTIEAALLV